MKKIVLLLTGTVNSSGINFMKRDDTLIRLNDYTNSISRWLSSTDKPIVFVENSGFDENSFKKDISKGNNLEYLSFYGQNFSRERGKGFGELNSIEYALKNSSFLKDADIIVKCNGRYFFKGLSNFENVEADVIANISRKLTFADSRVFAFTPSFFWENLLPYKEILNDSNGIYFEHILANAIHKKLGLCGKWESINFPIIIEGYSGTDNVKYNTKFRNIKTIAKFYIQKYFVS